MAGPCPCQGKGGGMGGLLFFFMERISKLKTEKLKSRSRKGELTTQDTLPRTDLTPSLTTHVCGVQVLEF